MSNNHYPLILTGPPLDTEILQRGEEPDFDGGSLPPGVIFVSVRQEDYNDSSVGLHVHGTDVVGPHGYPVISKVRIRTVFYWQGAKPGDEIESIDGHDCKGLTEAAMYALLKKKFSRYDFVRISCMVNTVNKSA